MLEFETMAKNMYAWDDEKGLFIPFSSTMRAVKSEISKLNSVSKEMVIERLKDDFNCDDISFCYNWLKKWEKIHVPDYKSQIPKEIDKSEIKSYLFAHCLSQLSLCTTEDCNFRCRYCSFSDFYEYNRGYSDKYMDFDTAKKAIDYFISLLNEGKKYNPIRKPALGFYGGEPLLNFGLIKKCIEYIESIYNDYEIIYTITTNGSMLDKKRANWLMEHDFIIFVSLDGPEDEHDRLRIYENGKGSFRDVIKNVTRIIRKGYKEIYCMPVFDWKSDLFKREEFFNRNDIPSVARIALVNNIEGCRYYEQFTEKDYSAFLGQLERARSCYYKDLNLQRGKEKLSFFDKLVGLDPGEDLFKSVSIYIQPLIMPFTGACIPGRKLFVDVYGNYHACERVNSSFPIGNVNDGLNFEKISKLIVGYLRSMDKCPSCKVSRKCTYCYQNFMTDNGFSPSSTVCENIESIKKASFARSFNIAEIYPEFVEESNYKHKNIKKYYGDDRNVFQT